MAKCSQIGLKPFYKINPTPKKGDRFWSKRPKKMALKQARPPPKNKSKSKSKNAITEPSDVDESQIGDVSSENDGNESQEDSVEVISISSDSSSPPPKPARLVCGEVPMSHPNACLDPNFLLKKAQHASYRKTRSHSGDLVSGLRAKTPTKKRQNENSPPSSGDSVMSALPPMIRVPGAQAKKRKTGGSTSTTAPEPIEKPAPTQANPTKDKPDDQADLPSSPKEGTETPNPPSPLKTTEDPDVVIITGTGFSKMASAVLSKHVSTSTQPSTRHEISKAKLSEYENLEFKELCSGFPSRLETSYEMEKNLLLMIKNRHEESLAQDESGLGDLKKSLADQQDAQAKSEEKCQVILSEMEKLKAAHKKAQADQGAALKRAEKAEAKLETMQQYLARLKQHISNMAHAIFGELTRSAARKGVLTMLSRCLAYAPELKPEEVAAGFPQLKDDGSEFTQDDYERVVKESCSAATQLATSLDLSKYQVAYDDMNKKINLPTFVTTSLTPRRPKNPFDLEADLSTYLNDEDESAALSKCNLVLGDLQLEVGQSSKQADPGAPVE
ncbi:hypothetical protein ZWY2020_025415 [Hordeum vulgare]|nr:hypothetical protein ZWY2020_025415 [Hordeum vulgare]